MKIGNKSREVLQLKGGETPSREEVRGFSEVDSIKILGRWIQNNAGVEEDWQQTKGKILAAHWANLEDSGAGLTSAGRCTDRIRCFNNATVGIVASASPSQPRSNVLACKYDKLQQDLIARLCPYAKPAATQWPEWGKMRAKWARGHIKKPWSSLGQRRQTKWYEHLQRHPHSWPSRMLKLARPSWLQEKRRSNYGTIPSALRSLFAGRTGTRVSSEHVAPKWSECFAARNKELAKFFPLGDRCPLEPAREEHAPHVRIQYDADGARRIWLNGEEVDSSSVPIENDEENAGATSS